MPAQEVKVWPLWGRITFVVLCALFLVGALVAAISGGFQLTWSAVRIYVAAAVVPGLLVYLVVAVLRRRSLRLISRLSTELDAVVVQVAASNQSPQVSSVAARARSQLEQGAYHSALDLVAQLRTSCAASGDPEVVQRYEQAARTARRLRRSLDAMARQGR